MPFPGISCRVYGLMPSYYACHGNREKSLLLPVCLLPVCLPSILFLPSLWTVYNKWKWRQAVGRGKQAVGDLFWTTHARVPTCTYLLPSFFPFLPLHTHTTPLHTPVISISKEEAKTICSSENVRIAWHAHCIKHNSKTPTRAAL